MFRYRNQFVLMLERKLQFRDVSIVHGVWSDGERFEKEQRLNWMNKKNPTVLEYQISFAPGQHPRSYVVLLRPATTNRVTVNTLYYR